MVNVSASLAVLKDWHNDIRAQFPILVQHPGLAYLDSAATAQKPQRVLDAVTGYLTTANANAGRGTYRWANRTTELIEQAAGRVKEFLRDRDSPNSAVHFVSGTSAGLRTIARDWLPGHLGSEDEIVVPYADHQANLLPWLELRDILAREGRTLTVRAMPVTPDGAYDVHRLAGMLSARTKFIAVTDVHHVYGADMNVARIREIAGPGPVICVDAAQSIGHRVVDADQLGADFIVFSGHKAMALPGTGVVWARNMRGPEFVPGGWAGTPNTVGIVSLHAAMDWLEWAGLERIEQWSVGLGALLVDELREIGPVRILGPLPGPDSGATGGRQGLVTFQYQGIPASDLGFILDAHDIMVRADGHCQGERGETETSVRASLHAYSSAEEVLRLAKVVASLSDQ